VAVGIGTPLLRLQVAGVMITEVGGWALQHEDVNIWNHGYGKA
jgi:hypothetical protein